MILEDFTIKFEYGKQKFYSFILNSWNVYERFLRSIFQTFQQKFNVNFYEIPNLSYEVDWDKRVEPDIVLWYEEDEPIIIDAKYKEEFKDEDFYQMSHYLGLSKAKNGFLIYPKSEELQTEQTIPFHLKDIPVRIHNILIDLSKVDDREYLDEFVNNICEYSG